MIYINANFGYGPKSDEKLPDWIPDIHKEFSDKFIDIYGDTDTRVAQVLEKTDERGNIDRYL
jgi:hypothetical protein